MGASDCSQDFVFVKDTRKESRGRMCRAIFRLRSTSPFVRHSPRRHLHVDQHLGHNEPVVSNQGPAGGLDPLLAVGRQGYIGPAGVLPAERPFRLAVPDDEHAGGCHIRDLLLVGISLSWDVLCDCWWRRDYWDKLLRQKLTQVGHLRPILTWSNRSRVYNFWDEAVEIRIT
jgi:hypothetical protein